MQSPSTATAAHPAHLGQPWASNSAHMYQNSNAAHHRPDPTNPRSSYPAPGTGQPAGDDQYPAYQQQQAPGGGGFGAVGGMAGYNYSGGNNVSSLYNTSPSLPSGSRRTSNPKASPPASAAVSTSPSTYYPRQSVGGASDIPQSPYQQPGSAGGQQVNVSPQQQAQYGGYAGYPYHGEQYGHPQGGQWPQHQYHQQPGGYPQQPGQQQRQTSAGSIPAGANAGASANDSAASRGGGGSGGGGSFDYPGTQPGQYNQGQWDQSRQGAPPHQWQQQQQQQQQQQSQQSVGAQQGRTPGNSGGQPQPMVNPWQGYGNHQPFPPPAHPVPHMGGQMPPGQYGWNQQWSGQGYYQQPPPGVQPQQSQPVGGNPPPPQAGKKSKNKKNANADPMAGGAPPPIAVPTDQLLGKRPAVDSAEDDAKAKAGKSKKNKKEEEKPQPKAPSKSHLKPPRQAPSAWQLFFADELNKAKASAAVDAGTTPGGTPIHPKLNVAQIAKDAGIAYAGLNEERKAHYARKVEEGKVQYKKDLKAWQLTLTPDDIKTENAFRTQQRKDGKSRKGNLKDPNAPKRPLSAYFLFLKGIRDNDDLRKSVWAEEAGTTTQSVLAAARWRGLSDDEKKPYLQQAEKDKQEYEELRKVYDDDAAARARGEDVPDRPQFQEIQSSVINPPESLLKPASECDLPPKASPKTEKKAAVATTTEGEGASTTTAAAAVVAAAAPVKLEGEAAAAAPADGAAATTADPVATATLTVPHEGSPDEVPTTAATNFDAALEIDEFHGFDDMDLTGLEGMTGHGESGEAQWDHLQYMEGGEAAPGAGAAVATGTVAEGEEAAANAGSSEADESPKEEEEEEAE